MASPFIEIPVGDRLVKVTNPDKVYFPQHGYTKRLIAAVPAIERRKQRFTLDATQVPSLVRPSGYEPPPARWREAGLDHRVREETA